MADHVRKQLRDAVVALLDDLVVTGNNAFPSRVLALQTVKLPALRIYTTEEESAASSIHNNPVIERVISLRVEGVASATTTMDDTLDAIAAEVEVALAGGVTIGSKTVNLNYSGCGIEISDDAEQRIGIITLNYQTRVFTSSDAPGVLL